MVIDVYIPNRKSKAGKRFGFVRFINVINMELLIGNLCTVWIGRMHLHANEVRFNRASKPNSTVPNTNANSNKARAPITYASTLKGSSDMPHTSKVPTLVLDDSCVIDRNLKLHVMASWFEELKNETNEFISKDRIMWVDIEGIPMQAWTKESFAKITTKWGSMMEIEDALDVTFARKRLCIVTKQEDDILEKFKVIIQGKVFMVRAKELYAWTPIFKEDSTSEYYSDDESVQGVEKEEVRLKHDDQSVEEEDELDAISETDLENEVYSKNSGNVQEPIISEDPFQIYKTLKTMEQEQKMQSEQSVPFPPGYTPIEVKETQEKETRLFPHKKFDQRELMLDGYSFTWAHKSTSKMSKLDRFLLSKDMVKREWTSMEIPIANSLVKFKLKLQQLKKAIRTWNQNRNKGINMEIIKVKTKLGEIDTILDHGHGSSDVLKCILELMKVLDEKKKLENMDGAQKAKVKWSIEGDENSKFFHGIINKKIYTLAIRGMMMNGEWVIDPNRIKKEFRKHFSHQFLKPPDSRCTLNFAFPKQLSAKQRDFLDGWVTRQEMKKAV
nr:hypothetical protein [Tanacetum cinerariifolium]